MNMISTLRQRVRQNGKAEITAEEYDQLQAEWITRTGAEEMVAAEREACAFVCETEWSLYTDSDGMKCAEAIRKRSNSLIRGASHEPK